MVFWYFDYFGLLAETEEKKKVWHKYLKAYLIFPVNKKPNFFLQAFLHFRQLQLQEHYIYSIMKGTTQTYKALILELQ